VRQSLFPQGLEADRNLYVQPEFLNFERDESFLDSILEISDAPELGAFMKTRFFAGLAWAALFLIGGRCFADGAGHASRASVALGGQARYGYAAQAGWRHDRDYLWEGRRYHWYNNAWYIESPDYTGYGSYEPSPTYDSVSESPDLLSAQVQSALYQLGYYRGAIDGIQGPRMQSAIAVYQRQHGLPVTGEITGGLIASLGIRE
jgi:hypothetical protein